MLPRRAFCSPSIRFFSISCQTQLRYHATSKQAIRLYSSASHKSTSSFRGGILLLLPLTLGAGVALYASDSDTNSLASIQSYQDEAWNPLATVPFAALLRGYFVYTCCSLPFLVDNGPMLIDWCSETSIPGVWSIAEYIVRNTFFSQFVGGESALECIDKGKQLLKQNLGVILNYSAESNDKKSKSDAMMLSNDKLCKDKVDAILNMIKLSATSFSEEIEKDLSNRSRDSMMIAVKLSGLVKDVSVLERASACLIPREQFSEPPTPAPPSTTTALIGPCASINIPTATLSQHDTDSLQQLWSALQDIAICARDNGNVRILIDAEHSWYQPAIDALFEACARQYNAVPQSESIWWKPFRTNSTPSSIKKIDFQGPLIYNTLQTYLRRTPAYLAMSLERAKQGNYALGIKLVRGAYVEQENEQWASKVVSTPPSHDLDGNIWKSPVWPNKDLTDQCFDNCAALLIKEIAKEVKSNGGTRNDFAHLGLVLAGHNWNSNMKVVQQMVDLGLARTNIKSEAVNDTKGINSYRNLQLRTGVRGRIHFAQQYGMADHLSRAIQISFDPNSGGVGPHLVLKFVPFGDLRLVMPYLIRRANENKSLMSGGGAQQERSLLSSEILRRLSPF